MQSTTFDRVLLRNLHEVARCVLYLRAMKGLEAANTDHAVDFVRLSYWALFNDCIAGAMRVFDKTRKAASFWYLRSCEQVNLDRAAAGAGLTVAEIESLASSLRLVRNKTHFHIDRIAVFDPAAVWLEANIKRTQLEHVLRGTYEALNHLYRTRCGDDFPLPDYDGTDAREIAKFAETLRQRQRTVDAELTD
jgi:hypothetical protein